MTPSAFQFTNPILLKLSMELNRRFTPENKRDLETKFHVLINKSNENREAVVELTVEIGGNELDLPFCLSITEGAKFKWDESADNKIETLLSQNAPALLLGYIRPIIATVTAASPFGAYHVPFIDFTQQEISENQ